MDITLTDEQISKLTPEQITEFEQDPESLKKYMADQEGKTDESQEEPEQEEESDEDGAANGAGEDDSEEEDEDEPVVLTKNGKKTIPYSEFKELRVENATLKEQLKGLQTAKTDLENLREEKANARSPERRAEIQKKLTERIASMKEDFPDIGNSMESVNELITDLSTELAEEKAANKARVKAEKERAEAAEAERVRVINEQVNEATAKNADLVYWKENDEDAWNEAVMQDAILMQNPKWSKKPIPERLLEVVKRVKAVLPDASTAPNAAPSDKTKEKAKAKLDKATARKPTTLSDIHGGDNPLSEKERAENMSGLELVNKLRSMPARQAAAMRADLD